MHRRTLVNIMKALRDQGGHMSRTEVGDRWDRRSRLDAVLSHDYPRGLRNLVLEEEVAGRTRPVKQWTLTPDGMQLLNDLLTDPKAMPPIHRGRPAITESVDAQEYRKARNRRYLKCERRKRKRARPGYRKTASWRYLEPLEGIDPRDWKQFKKLTNLQRIQILRTNADRNRKEN